MAVLFLIVSIWIVLALFVGISAKSNGRTVLWSPVVLITGVFGLLAYLLTGGPRGKGDVKWCDFCEETKPDVLYVPTDDKKDPAEKYDNLCHECRIEHDRL